MGGSLCNVEGDGVRGIEADLFRFLLFVLETSNGVRRGFCGEGVIVWQAGLFLIRATTARYVVFFRDMFSESVGFPFNAC